MHFNVSRGGAFVETLPFPVGSGQIGDVYEFMERLMMQNGTDCEEIREIKYSVSRSTTFTFRSLKKRRRKFL